MFTENVNFQNLQFSNCVTFVFFSLSLFFFSPKSVSPFSWHGSNHSPGLQSFFAPMNITCDWIIKLFLSPEHSRPITCRSTTSHGYALRVCVRAFMCVCVCVFWFLLPPPSFQTLSLLPGLWKANEESWAEGSFCVLVKKNNLCQRKVLQQLCCRTCSQKGWRDILTEQKGSARGGCGGTGYTPPQSPLPTHSQSHNL